MKNNVILLILTLSLCLDAKSQCDVGNLTISSQAGVDNFHTNYPGCTEISGEITISGYDISNLNGLYGLTSIESLVLIGTSINSLSGLGTLDSILDLNITDCQITDFNGLQNVNSIDYFYVQENPRLKNFEGLNNLNSIKSYVEISYNDSLSTLNGLENLDELVEGAYFAIISNPNLMDIQALSNMEAAFSEVHITGNTNLSSCNIESLCSFFTNPFPASDIGNNAPGCNSKDEVTATCSSIIYCPGPISITTQDEIDNFISDQGCNVIEGDLTIEGDQISNLQGLSGIQKIWGELDIINTHLHDLRGLENVQGMFGGVSIFSNDSLTSILNLGNSTSIIGIINATYNPNLILCNVPYWCPGYVNSNNYHNALGCNYLEICSEGCGIYESPNVDLIFNKQIEIDSFPIIFPDCTHIGGNVMVQLFFDNANLDGLNQITTIDGDLVIASTGITEITGFNGLQNVNGNIYIGGNPVLENISGFQNIKKIESGFEISNNDVLTNINISSELDSIGGGLYIESNNQLATVAGFDGLTKCDIVSIMNNPSLVSIQGFNSLHQNNNYDNGIYITDNPQLTSIAAFGAISETGVIDFRNLAISNLPELSNLTSAYYLNLKDLPNLTSLTNLDNLMSVEMVDIGSNIPIQDLTGLENLNTVYQYFSVINANSLTTLNGLDNINSIQNLTLTDNLQLSDISAIQNVTFPSTGEITIRGCHQLAVCDYDNICSAVLSNEQQFDIYDNALGCENLIQLYALCMGGICTGEVNLSNQHELDEFGVIITGCTNYEGNINISGLDITHLDALSNLVSINGGLEINFNDSLTSLAGLEALTSVGGLSLKYNPKLSNIEALSNLTTTGSLDLINNNSLITLHGLEGLESSCKLQISDNANLQSVSGLDNLMISNTGCWVDIYNNPNLSDCAILPVCNFINIYNDDVTIYGNATGCNSNAEVEAICVANNSFAAGTVFVDLNCNGILDGNDVGVPDKLIKKSISGVPIASSDDAGNYQVYLQPNISLEFEVNPLSGYTAFPASHLVTTDNIPQNYTGLDFRYCPDNLFHDLSVHITALSPPRPGFSNLYQVCVNNLGTYPEDGQLSFDFSGLPNGDYASIIDADGGAVSGNTITWDLFNIPVLGTICMTIEVAMSVNTPLGEVLYPRIVMSGNSSESNIEDNAETLPVLVVGSFDPNDKTATPDSFLDDGSQEPREIEYLIRFQNTGTFPATTVVVVDTLEEMLDIRSFQMISASHPYSLTFPADNVLKWTFNDINLPDSTSNELESHGFVRFSLKTTEGLSIGDEISNRAFIYFDFNEPVETNSTSTNFVTAIRQPFAQNGLEVIPNPVKSSVNILFDLLESSDVAISIHNMQGMVLIHEIISDLSAGKKQLRIDLSDLPSGFYTLLLTTEGGNRVQMLIKE